MDEKSIRLFIGPHANYYIRKFSTVEMTGQANTWNWGAFLFSIFWLAYRRMYVYAGIFAFLILLFSFIALVFNFNSELFLIMLIIWPVVLGIFGNRIYRFFIESQILQIYAMQLTEQDIPTVIKESGGTNLLAVVASIMLFAIVYYYLLFWLNYLPVAYRPLNLLKILFS